VTSGELSTRTPAPKERSAYSNAIGRKGFHTALPGCNGAFRCQPKKVRRGSADARRVAPLGKEYVKIGERLAVLREREITATLDELGVDVWVKVASEENVGRLTQ
jgi:hypothetical protein